jgi:hypothetical protein
MPKSTENTHELDQVEGGIFKKYQAVLFISDGFILN